MNSWYVVWTKPREEVRATEHLRRQGFHVWLPWIDEPTRRSGRCQQRRAPLFPRYCFLFADAEQKSLAAIRSSRGCCDLVRISSAPAVVPQPVIDELQKRCDPEGVLHLRKEWQPGESLEFIAGPCAGLKAIFEAHSSGDRVQVLLHWLGAWQRATVSRDCLASAS